jgi:Bacterial Ig-like domain
MKTTAVLARTTVLSIFVTVLIGCNGGGDSSSDTTAPTLAATIPLQDAKLVDITTPISASFSEELLASTVGVNVTLKQVKDNKTIPITPSLNGNVISIDHPALNLRTSYTATLGTGLTDLARNTFAGSSWNFTTRDGTWQNIEQIDDQSALSHQAPQIAMDKDGNAVAVWVESTATESHIWANRYTPGIGWDTAQQIETQTPKYRSGPQVALDQTGHAIAVWSQTEAVSARNDIFASRYTPSSGWSQAQEIDAEPVRTAVNPVIAMNPSGNAVAVWAQNDGTRANIWANTYAPSTGWATPELIETNNKGTANNPRIAMDSKGNAHVVWIQSEGVWGFDDSIWANIYRPGLGWSVAFPIENELPEAYSPDISVDGSGNAMAIWTQIEMVGNQGTSHVWANRYTPSSGWGAAQPIKTENAKQSYLGRVALDAAGNAIAVWVQENLTTLAIEIWTNNNPLGQNWGTPQALQTVSSQKGFDPRIAVDSNGNAITMWSLNGGLMAKRYTTDSGWGNPVKVSALTSNGVITNSVTAYQVAFDAAGNAITVFDLIGPHIWSSVFR